MDRIRSLTGYQKGILIVLTFMVLLFAVLYGIVTSRVGYRYHDAILVPTEENGNTIYEGKVEGFPSSITVTEDKTVTFRFGEKRYGPYTMKEDPEAIPQDHNLADHMTGIVITDESGVFFEGGVLDMEDPVLFSKDENDFWVGSIYATMSDGTIVDGNGNTVDPVELLMPSPTTVLKLMGEPELTHKGHWTGWIFGVLLSAALAVSILFVDELFEFFLSFRVNYIGKPEPSDWEIASRSIGWAVCTILVLNIYLLGLQ